MTDDTDMPRHELVAEVERLRAALDATIKENARYIARIKLLDARIDRARDVLEGRP